VAAAGTPKVGRPHRPGWRPIATVSNGMDCHMHEERIQVRVTSSGRTLDVVVLKEHLDNIQIVLGER